MLFVFCWSDIISNPSAGATTDHSQSAKDTDTYFKSKLYVEDPDHRKTVLILPNGLSKPGERGHDRSLIYAVGGIRTHYLLIDNPECPVSRVQCPVSKVSNPVSYYHSIVVGGEMTGLCVGRVRRSDGGWQVGRAWRVGRVTGMSEVCGHAAGVAIRSGLRGSLCSKIYLLN